MLEMIQSWVARDQNMCWGGWCESRLECGLGEIGICDGKVRDCFGRGLWVYY